MGRKQLQINKGMIGDIVSAFNDMIETCRDPAVLDKLKPLAKRAEELPVSDSKKMVDIDEELLSCVKELQAAIGEGNIHMGQFLIEKISDLFKKHTQACPPSYEHLSKSARKLQIKKDKQARKASKRRARLIDKGSIDELKREIKTLEDENKKAEERCDILKKQLRSATTKSEFEQVKSQLRTEEYLIASNEESIQALYQAIERKSTQEILEKQGKTVKKAKEAAPYNDEELVTQEKKLEREREHAAQSQSVVDSIMDNTIKRRNARGETDASPVDSAEETWTNPYAGKQNPYGPSAPQRGRVEDYFEDVDEQVGLLKGTVREIEREIGKKEGKLRELSEEIRGLLQKRREASAAECVVLDGTIDSKYSAYSTVKLGIDRLNQERAKYSMELNIVEQIKDIRDAAERNERIAEMSGGRFLDIGALALAVSEDTARKNEIIAEARDAVAVANATSIDSRTFAETGVTYDTGVKDEDKYAGMEREFGLRS